MFEVRELCAGRFRRVLGPFERRSQAEAHAIDWLALHGYAIINRELDAENDAIDIMTARHGALYQFAIEKARQDA